MGGGIAVGDGERACWAALAALPGLRPARVLELVADHGSGEAVWRLPAPRLARLVGLDGAAARRLAAAKAALDPGRLAAAAARLGARLITWLDADYPPPLRDLSDPPLALYCLGRLPRSWRRAVAVVGTRQADETGRRVAERLARALAGAGALVVSGLARGIDAAAHRGALRGGGETVAVLGCGLDRVYPPEHAALAREVAARGALLTEYPPGTAPLPAHFPWRNRLIAALARVTVVVQADRRSGALITASHAADLGREVMAVPGDVDRPRSRGTNLLLAAGAQVVTGPEDVLAALGWAPAGPAEAPREAAPRAAELAGSLSDAENKVLRCLSRVPQTVDRLAACAGLPAGTVVAALVALEVHGLASRLAGATYIRVEEDACADGGTGWSGTW